MRFQLKPGHTNLLIVLKLVACVIFGISCIFIINRFLSYLFPLTPIITYEIINVHYSNPNVDTNVTVGDVFEAERDRVKKKLRFFNIFKKLESLSNLTPETNGRPIQSGEFLRTRYSPMQKSKTISIFLEFSLRLQWFCQLGERVQSFFQIFWRQYREHSTISSHYLTWDLWDCVIHRYQTNLSI